MGDIARQARGERFLAAFSPHLPTEEMKPHTWRDEGHTLLYDDFNGHVIYARMFRCLETPETVYVEDGIVFDAEEDPNAEHVASVLGITEEQAETLIEEADLA